MSYIIFSLAFVLTYLFIKNRQEAKEDKYSTSDIEDKPLSKEESFALEIGTLEHERIERSLELFNLRDYIKDEWGIDQKEEGVKENIIYQLQQLWSRGTLSIFMEHEFLKKELKVKDLIAFDSARFTELIRQLLYLELIEEKEAWGLLFLNAQRVQDSFENAEDFTNSYFKGAIFYEIIFKTEEKKREKKLENFNKIFMELQSQNETIIEWIDEALFTQLTINEMEN